MTVDLNEDPELIKKGLVICRQKHLNQPFGVFYGENPLDYSFPLALLQIVMVVSITRIVRFLLKPFKQPRIVSEILGCIIIGPSVLSRSKKFKAHMFPDNADYIMKNIGVMGFMYYLFLSGVKMDITVVKKAGKRQWCLAFTGIVIPLLCTTAMAVIMRKNLGEQLKNAPSIYGIASALSITAFPVLYPILRELNLLSSEIGRMALSISVISDVIGIHGIVVFEAAKQGEAKSIAALWYVISLVIIVASIMVGVRQAMIWIVKTTPEGKPVDQVYVVTILLGVLIAGFVTDACGIAVCNGPLFLGLAVPDGPPLGATLVEKSETIVMDILLPFSFTFVGMITDFSSMSGQWSNLQPLFFMALTGYITKLLATLITGLFFNMTFRDSLTLGLIVSLRGQVELILFIHWMDLKMISRPHFTMMVILTTMVTALATPLISMIYDPTRPYIVNKRRNIQHQPPNTEMHIVACLYDEKSVGGITNLLEVSNPTTSSPFSVYAIHLIELIARATPVFIHHDDQDPDSENNISSIHNALKLFQEARGENIKIHCYTSVSPKRSMFQDICELALMKKASLIILSENKECVDNLTGTETVRQGVHPANLKVLTNAPCSVAILVEKDSFRSHLLSGSMRRSVHHFVVLFLGGADAREALTYADRMAVNPDVSLTAIRFLSHNNEGDNEMEKKLDDGLVTWFWVKNEGNNKVVYREVVVNNGAETVAAIQAMNTDHCDLWIVGRKHGINPKLIEGLSNWSENHELGAIGDYVSSADFNSRASVLVVQQQILRG